MYSEVIEGRIDKGDYIVELVRVETGEDSFTMQSARSKKDNGYIGDEGSAQRLIEHGITPELIDAEHQVCSVGFNAKNNKWYGWSHRALCAFGIGDKIFEEDFGDDNTPYNQHGAVTIETLEDARQAAANFARSVS